MDTIQDQTVQQEAQAQTDHPNDRQLEQCQVQLEKVKNDYIRLSADFKNFQNRQDKERAQWTKLAQIDVIAPLLTIIDDFERALQQKDKEPATVTITGFELIYKELVKYLDKIGIKTIGVKPKDQFNPELHESVMQETAEQESDTIVNVLQKGYMFKDVIIRPAKVSVAS